LIKSLPDLIGYILAKLAEAPYSNESPEEASKSTTPADNRIEGDLILEIIWAL